MRKRFRWLTTLFFLLTFVLLARPVLADLIVTINQVDPSNFPQMVLYITIEDSAGAAVPPLTKEDFAVTEDGENGRVIDFVGDTDTRPVDIVFVFDTTGSMNEEINGVKNTAISFANQLSDKGRDFRLGLVSFGDEILAVRKNDRTLTDDAEEFKRWIGTLVADGGGDDPEIALDGVQTGMEMNFREGSQKVLILITDAPPHERGDGTTFSSVVPQEQIKQAVDSGFTVYAVAFDHTHFRNLATQTHGHFYDLNGSTNFTDIIDELGGLIAAQYRLTYESPRKANDGTRRNIIVTAGGVASESIDYLEPHLLVVDSRWGVGLLMLLPLLIALVLPTLYDRVQGTPRRPAAVAQNGASSVQPPVYTDPPPPPGGIPAVPCRSCGRPNPPDFKFCRTCGHPTAPAPPPAPTPAPPVASIQCSSCGAPLRAGARFCARCGQTTNPS